MRGIVMETAEMYQAYREWVSECVCEECGAKQSDRPRGQFGQCLDTWMTETLCGKCSGLAPSESE